MVGFFLPYLIGSLSELPFILAFKAGADIFSEDMELRSVVFSSFVNV